jgi:hypothetical protein
MKRHSASWRAGFMRRIRAHWTRGGADLILLVCMAFVRLLRPVLACLLLVSFMAGPVLAAVGWRSEAWVLGRRQILGGHDCELRLASPASAARVTLRSDRLGGGWEVVVFEARRDVPIDAGDVFSWRRSDGSSGDGRLAVLGIGLAMLRLPSTALQDLPAAGEIEMAGAGVPFVWRIPLTGLAEGLMRLERCSSGE